MKRYFDPTWLPKMLNISVPSAYWAKATEQNWIVAVVASRIRAILNRKLLIIVAPGRMGCTCTCYLQTVS